VRPGTGLLSSLFSIDTLISEPVFGKWYTTERNRDDET